MCCPDSNSTVTPDLSYSTVSLLTLGKAKIIQWAHNTLPYSLNSYTSLSMLLIAFLTLSNKCWNFCYQIQALLLHSAPFLFLALVHKTIYVVMFLVAIALFRLLYHSLYRYESCLLTPFEGVIYHAEATYSTLHIHFW